MNFALSLLLLLLAGCATPITGDKTATGGATEQRISESIYVVKARLNGFTSAAALKPTVLLRANQIGQSQGFASFEIESFDVSFDPRSNGFSSEAQVRFSRKAEEPIPNRRYRVGSETASSYKASLTPAELRGLVKLSGSSTRDAAGTLVRIEPVFIDAVGSEHNNFTSGMSDAYVRPGILEFAAFVQVNTGMFKPRGSDIVKVRALVVPNSNYTLVARFAGGRIEYWIEDDESKKPANAPESTTIAIY